MTGALSYLQQAGQRGSRLGLERITQLLHRLGDPQASLRCIHVAGTNGKGSVSALLAAILNEAGYRTGLYTSPHLVRLHERVQIGGREIGNQDLALLTEAVRAQAEEMDDPPTQFELLTALAFLHFQRQACDLAVVEVGLGGRLDSTNVISSPAAAVLTHMGLEHTEVLGNTLEQIAAEKAGIIKAGCPVVLTRQDLRVELAVRRRCQALRAPLRVTEPVCLTPVRENLDGQVFHYRARTHLKLGLLGRYQLQNAAAVLDTVDTLAARGYPIPEEAIRAGLARAAWPGRFEVLQRDPPVILDGAHNPQGAAELMDCLRRYLPGRRLVFLAGVMADKDYREMMALAAPHAQAFFTVTPPSPRALPAETLAETVRTLFAGPAVAAGSVEEGLALALDALGGDGVLCVFGSLYQAGAVRDFFGKN